MLNSVNLMGRLAKTPELRYTGNNTPVAAFTLAVDRDYQSGGSERQTDFVECVAWRSTAEFVSRYFAKGQMMALHGSLQSRKWTDKNDNNRVSWEVVADSVYFCGDKKKDAETGSPKRVDASDFEELPGDESDLPF